MNCWGGFVANLARVALMLAWPMQAAGKPKEFGPFAEPDFPVLTATVDFTPWKDLPASKNNICVRGLILKLPNQCVLCFDTDTLRVAAVWKGKSAAEFLTNEGIAAKSYHLSHGKADGGIKELPKPLGQPIFLAEPGPGWSFGSIEVPVADPRPMAPGALETGRGPLPPDWAQFKGIAEEGGGVVIRYTVGGTEVTEDWFALGDTSVVRVIKLAPHEKPLALWAGNGAAAKEDAPRKSPLPLPTWSPVEASGSLGDANGNWCVDKFQLPLENPSRRNIRPSGIDFFADGRAVICTIEGDVWVLSGLDAKLAAVRWQRLAGGLHEPQAVRVVAGQVYVF
jgi:hypothetical protein